MFLSAQAGFKESKVWNLEDIRLKLKGVVLGKRASMPGYLKDNILKLKTYIKYICTKAFKLICGFIVAKL